MGLTPGGLSKISVSKAVLVVDGTLMALQSITFEKGLFLIKPGYCDSGANVY